MARPDTSLSGRYFKIGSTGLRGKALADGLVVVDSITYGIGSAYPDGWVNLGVSPQSLGPFSLEPVQGALSGLVTGIHRPRSTQAPFITKACQPPAGPGRFLSTTETASSLIFIRRSSSDTSIKPHGWIPQDATGCAGVPSPATKAGG